MMYEMLKLEAVAVAVAVVAVAVARRCRFLVFALTIVQ